MARYTNTPKTSLKGINAELVKVQDAFEDVLDRKGDGANFLDTDLDMNSQRILNLPEPVYSQEPVRLGDVKPFIDDTKTARDAAVEAAGVAQESEEQAAVSAGQAASSAEQSAASAANSAAKAKDLTEITSALLISQGLSGEYGFFEKGFTYNESGDVGIDSYGNIWTYNGTLPFEVTAGDVPSEPAYKQVTFNEAQNVSASNGSNVQTELDKRATDEALWGDRFVGYFADGFTYTSSSDVAKGSDGNYYSYIGASAYPVVVTAGTDESGSDYAVAEAVGYKPEFDTVDGAVAYTKIDKLVGRCVKIKNYHQSTSYGAGEWNIMLTSSVTSDDFALASIVNPTYSIVAIPLAGPADIYLHQFGVWINDNTNNRDLDNFNTINNLIQKSWVKSIRLPDDRVYHKGALTLKSGIKIHGGGPRNSILHNTATSGDAISGVGTGIDLPDAISNQTVMSGVVLRDFLSDSDGNDNNGIVLDIARNCVIDNVWSFNHGNDQYHLGSACDDSISTNDKNDLLTLTNGYAFGGVNGYYFGSMSGITLQHLLSNGYSDYGVVIEDCGIFNFNDSNIGSGLASAKDAVIVRNSATNTSNARSTTTINIHKVHSEQLKSGYGLCRVAMTGTTKAISVNVNGCDQYPINADYVIFEGVTEDCSIDGNGLVQSTAADGGNGIVIGNQSVRTYIGRLRWRNNLVNVQDNAPSDGTIYWDRNLENQIFYYNDIAASLTNQNMSLVQGSSVVQLPVSEDGNLLGAQIRISNPITQGSIEVNIVKNGTEIPFSATLTSASQSALITIPRGATKLNSGDLLVCRFTSSGDIIPNNTIDIICNLKMEISRQ